MAQPQPDGRPSASGRAPTRIAESVARWCSRQQAVGPTLTRRTRPRDAKGRRSALRPRVGGAHRSLVSTTVENLIPWRRQLTVADTWVADRSRSPRSATLGCATDGVANFDLYRRSGRRVRIVDESPLSIGGRPGVLAVAKGAPPVPVLGPLEPCHIAPTVWMFSVVPGLARRGKLG